jgi:hypothetical protein
VHSTDEPLIHLPYVGVFFSTNAAWFTYATIALESAVGAAGILADLAQSTRPLHTRRGLTDLAARTPHHRGCGHIALHPKGGEENAN